jgi:hypothetical protein
MARAGCPLKAVAALRSTASVISFVNTTPKEDPGGMVVDCAPDGSMSIPTLSHAAAPEKGISASSACINAASFDDAAVDMAALIVRLSIFGSEILFD